MKDLIVINRVDRTKCNACRIVGREAETHKKAMAKGTAVKEYFEDEFCGKLGYSHQPYNWIESVCEEMVEDKIGELPIELITQFLHDESCRRHLGYHTI